LSKETLKIIECSRDAMQGIKKWIPTQDKIDYLQSLLSVGYDTLDCGSFVSHNTIPQMKDTGEVLQKIDLSKTSTKILVIIANTRGAVTACNFPQIDFLGYPFSISENFQMRNTHKTIKESILILEKINLMAKKNNKKVVVYLSMGFGNPYGEPWNYEIVEKWVKRLYNLGIEYISLSDTVGIATPKDIKYLFKNLIYNFSKIEFGAHFHTSPNKWFEKVDAAFAAGCNRFDSVIKGYGGCPMAKDDLVGNLPTENLITFLQKKKKLPAINLLNFEKAYNNTLNIFS